MAHSIKENSQLLYVLQLNASNDPIHDYFPITTYLKAF